MAAVVALLVAGAAAFVVGARVQDPDSRSSAGWWLYVVVPMLLMVAVLLVVLRLQRQERFSWLPGPGLLLGADRATRRRVSRCVRRGDLPRNEPERALVLDTARRIVASRWFWLVFAFTAVIQAANALVTSSSLLRWLFAANAAVCAAAWVAQLFVLRGARRVLASADPAGAGARLGDENGI